MDARQQAGEVEAGGAHFAGVEVFFAFPALRDLGHQCPHIGIGGVAKYMQVFHRGCANLVGVGFALFYQPGRQLIQIFHGLLQWRGKFLQVVIGGNKAMHFLTEMLVERAAIGDQFTSGQIQRLDAVGAFVNLGDAAIAHQLLLAPLADIAVAAKYHLAVQRGFQTHVGHKGFGHRSQQGDQFAGLLLGVGIVGELGQIELFGDIGRKCTAALVERFHGQQHAAHIGVHDDRISGFFWLLCAGRCAALDAFAGVFNGALVGTLGHAQTLNAHAQALVVHHGEHGGQPLVGLVDDITHGIVEVHHASGRGLDAHLVFD